MSTKLSLETQLKNLKEHRLYSPTDLEKEIIELFLSTAEEAKHEQEACRVTDTDYFGDTWEDLFKDSIIRMKNIIEREKLIEDRQIALSRKVKIKTFFKDSLFGGICFEYSLIEPDGIITRGIYDDGHFRNIRLIELDEFDTFGVY